MGRQRQKESRLITRSLMNYRAGAGQVLTPEFGQEKKEDFLRLTNPCLSEMLLVSLSLWKETTFCIHCSPVVGLSGWMYMRFGISGSALPATIHRLEWECDDIAHEWTDWLSE